MDKNNFDLLMQSLEEAKSHAKGKKGKARVTSWEIKPAVDFAAKDVRRIRHKVGLSQVLFAEFLGVSVRTIQAWEQGLSHPSGASSRLLEALDRSKDKCLSLYQDIKVISAVG